jgi:hypothetical protein
MRLSANYVPVDTAYRKPRAETDEPMDYRKFLTLEFPEDQDHSESFQSPPPRDRGTSLFVSDNHLE